MKKAYLLVLAGQGDIQIELVSKEVFDWVISGKNIPKGIEYEESPYSSSPDNDRALSTGDACIECFWSMKEALDYLNKNNYEIEDTYEGVIY